MISDTSFSVFWFRPSFTPQTRFEIPGLKTSDAPTPNRPRLLRWYLSPRPERTAYNRRCRSRRSGAIAFRPRMSHGKIKDGGRCRSGLSDAIAFRPRMSHGNIKKMRRCRSGRLGAIALLGRLLSIEISSTISGAVHGDLVLSPF